MGFEVETASPCATHLLAAGKRDVESDASTKVQPYKGERMQIRSFFAFWSPIKDG